MLLSYFHINHVNAANEQEICTEWRKLKNFYHFSNFEAQVKIRRNGREIEKNFQY